MITWHQCRCGQAYYRCPEDDPQPVKCPYCEYNEDQRERDAVIFDFDGEAYAKALADREAMLNG